MVPHPEDVRDWVARRRVLLRRQCGGRRLRLQQGWPSVVPIVAPMPQGDVVYHDAVGRHPHVCGGLSLQLAVFIGKDKAEVSTFID